MQVPAEPKHLRRWGIAIVLLVAFLFRLGFGLCSDFWNPDEDVRQIYLIGLKFYATRNWPYFGPDVAPGIQIPGALQGLAVGLPFYVLPIPEAPYVLLNILSFASLVFFCWYCTRRLPQLPNGLVWAWILTVPWTLGLSPQVYNPSYVLAGAILFFIGLIETLPFLTHHLISPALANFMMGVALFWIMQFHLSWVVLVPFVLLSFYFRVKKREYINLLWFGLGAILSGAFLLPTFIKYGFDAGLGGTNQALEFNFRNLLQHVNIVEGVLGRFLSFASFEVPRFIGNNTNTRLAFIKENLWLSPFIVFLTAVGILQSVALFFLWFRRKHSEPDWRAMEYFTLGTIVLLYVSFLFSMKAPVSHTFYVTFPIAMLYSLYCWQELLKKNAWRKFALVVIVCGIVFHAGLAWHNFKHDSLYVDRHRVQQAISEKDFHILGERRAGARY